MSAYTPYNFRLAALARWNAKKRIKNMFGVIDFGHDEEKAGEAEGFRGKPANAANGCPAHWDAENARVECLTWPEARTLEHVTLPLPDNLRRGFAVFKQPVSEELFLIAVPLAQRRETSRVGLCV